MFSETTANSIAKSEFKRLMLIGIQIKNILDELADNDEECKKKYQKAVENKYIKSFIFYAMKSGKSYAELEVLIDWDEYQNQIDRGNIVIKTKSEDGILAPTKNIATRFREYADNNNFSIKWQFRYADGINRETANKMLGATAGDVIERADECCDFISKSYQVGELTELTYVMKI